MRTMIFLLVLSLFLAGCGPTDSAIETAIAQTQEAQASTSQQPAQAAQDTPAATETVPPSNDVQPQATPLPPIVETTQSAQSQEVQLQPDLPTLVYSGEGALNFNEAVVLYAGSEAGKGKLLLYKGDYEHEGQVRAVDTRSWNDLWVADVTGRLVGADADLVYTRPSKQRIDALDIDTGEVRWRYLSEQPLMWWITMSDDHFVVFYDESNRDMLYVIDKSDGTLTSALEVDKADNGDPMWQNSAQCGNGKVINGKLGFLSDAGQLEWLIQDVPWWRFCGEVFLYPAAEGLEAIDMNTGTSLWTSDFAAQLRDRTGIMGCGAEDILIRVDGRMHAISIETGELSWTEPEEVIGSWVGEADGMLVYAHAGYGLTRAYDKANHALVWETPQFALNRIVGVADDTLIGVFWQSSSDQRPGVVVGLDSHTGTELWRSEVATTGLDGRLNIAMMYGRLFYVLNRKSGIKFIDPRSGDLIVETPFEAHWTEPFFDSLEGMIVVHRGELAVIRP